MKINNETLTKIRTNLENTLNIDIGLDNSELLCALDTYNNAENYKDFLLQITTQIIDMQQENGVDETDTILEYSQAKELIPFYEYYLKNICYWGKELYTKNGQKFFEMLASIFKTFGIEPLNILNTL